MLSATEIAIAVWCVRIMGTCAVIALATAAVSACMNYIYHEGKHMKAFCEYLIWKRGQK